MSFAEREEIALLHAQKFGVCEIARRIERAPSTISRELRRNAATRSGGFEYRASTAQWHAERKAKRPKVAKLAANTELRQYVQERLAGAIAVGKRCDGRPRCELERSSSRSPARSALGNVVESRADFGAAKARLPG